MAKKETSAGEQSNEVAAPAKKSSAKKSSAKKSKANDNDGLIEIDGELYDPADGWSENDFESSEKYEEYRRKLQYLNERSMLVEKNYL